ncbi:unnamed protein product, partial [Vitis vinifera]
MASIGYPEILLAVICFLLLHRLSNSNMLPWNWPLVGMLPWIFRNIQQIQDRCTEVLEQSSGTFLLKGPWFANMDMLITSDPANVHYIMSTNFSNFPKGPEKLAQVLINDRQFQQFLGLLVDLQDLFQSTMELKSNKFLRDTIVNFLLAGRDTTSAALTWFFWLVSKNPLLPRDGDELTILQGAWVLICRRLATRDDAVSRV